MSIGRAMFILECLNAGIIPPVDKELISSSPTAYLDELPPDEARRAKRKFRKLHRKIKKEKRQEVESMLSKKGMSKRTSWRTSGEKRRQWVKAQSEKIDADFGLPGEKPDCHQLRKRRSEVMQEIWRRFPELK